MRNRGQGMGTVPASCFLFPVSCCLLLLAGCPDNRSAPPSPAASSAQPTRPQRPPKPINLATATTADLRDSLDRLGWSIAADLSTEFDSCKSSVLEITRGDLRGRVTLHDCSDEYDARRKQTANARDDVFVERVNGKMLETTIPQSKDEGHRLHAALLGR